MGEWQTHSGRTDNHEGLRAKTRHPGTSLRSSMLPLQRAWVPSLVKELRSHMQRAMASNYPWCWRRLRAGGEGGNRGCDGWMASSTQWAWMSANFGRWWRTKDGTWLLQSMGVTKNWTTTTKLIVLKKTTKNMVSCFKTKGVREGGRVREFRLGCPEAALSATQGNPGADIRAHYLLVLYITWWGKQFHYQCPRWIKPFSVNPCYPRIKSNLYCGLPAS